MRLFFVLILVCFVYSSCALFSIRDYSGCCSWHGSVDNCVDNKIVCSDGYVSSCDCGSAKRTSDYADLE